MKTKKPVSEIPESKKQTVKELKDLFNKKTILIASIKNIPASQFQEIGKKLRGKAIVKVPKKNLIERAFDESKNEGVKKLKEKIIDLDSFAFLFSDLDAYDLAGELVKNKSPAKAKPGQEAPEDIEVPEGPTDLVPGPAISELGALGIQIQIDKGKIHIKQAKVIAKKGEKIKSNACDLMAKLDIKPFSIGFIPLMAFDPKENKLYTDIKIDREGVLQNLLYAYSKALPFAVNVGYVSSDTIKHLLGKAERHAKRLNKVITGEPDVVEEVKEEIQETKVEEKPVDATAGLAGLFG